VTAVRLSLVFAAALSAALTAQDVPSPERLMQTLNTELLNSRSATATLERWCRDHRLASEPKIVARLVPGAVKTPSAEQRARLDVTDRDEVKYRRVELRCGSQTLSEADNWYVPSRLSAEMNRLLDTTDTPFGRAVAALEPYRRTIATQVLWNGEGAAPSALFEHRAVLYTRDHQPFSEVVEVYQRQVLPSTPATRLQGRWKLTAAEDLRADGSVARHPWGRNPVGSIVVEGGWCYVQIMSSDVPAFAAGASAVGEQMRAALLSTYIAYSGACTVDEAEGSVTLKVDAAWRPDYVGTDQKRFFRFEGGRMFFGPAPNSIRAGDERLTRRLTLERQ
jgi:chorismate-pyruvate lyase